MIGSTTRTEKSEILFEMQKHWSIDVSLKLDLNIG